jgi:type I restriction enzyme S subunit
MKFRWEMEFKETEIGEIPKDWEVKKINEIGEIGGGSTPSTKVKDYWDGDIPWITPKDLANHGSRFISCGERNITRKAVIENSLKLYPNGTILLTSRAPIGYVAIIKNPVTTNQGFKNIAPKEGTNSEFLYYLLINISEYLKDISGGSTFEELTKEILKDVLIPFPPLPEQSRIATVLSWFDDLIENKRRQNEILEKTAMAIFKSWFIDFEPFRACPEQERGNYEFVYNEELGREIPKGWEVKKIGEVVKFIYGEGLPERNRKEGIYPVVGSSGIVGFHSEYIAEPPTIIIGRKGNAGSVQLFLENSYPIDTVFYSSKHTAPEVIFYIYHLLKIISLEDMALTDTAVPGLNIHMLNSLIIFIPPPHILQYFHSLIEPLFQKIILNQKQIMTLRKIKDTLLPLLVFGKLRVEEI